MACRSIVINMVAFRFVLVLLNLLKLSTFAAEIFSYDIWIIIYKLKF